MKKASGMAYGENIMKRMAANNSNDRAMTVINVQWRGRNQWHEEANEVVVIQWLSAANDESLAAK